MTQFCIACDRKLDIISNNDDEHTPVICECGVINQIDYMNSPRRQLNVVLIKNKMLEILKQKSFEKIDEQTKQDIIKYASRIGTHVTNSLKCFALIYIESKNLIYINDEFSIKKRQRKTAIQILVNINKNEPTIFVRTPLTYIQTYANEYSTEERKMYIDISHCLLFLNACNKKNMQSIYEKIHYAILYTRSLKKLKNHTSFQVNDSFSNNYFEVPVNENVNIQPPIKTSNLNTIIMFIAINRITIKDLIYAETIFIQNSINSFK